MFQVWYNLLLRRINAVCTAFYHLLVAYVIVHRTKGRGQKGVVEKIPQSVMAGCAPACSGGLGGGVCTQVIRHYGIVGRF